MLDEVLKRTPLHGLHLELGARMTGFAGYDMPVQYPAGILAEHLHTRQAASLFDVSHMGQARLWESDRVAELETFIPGDIQGLALGKQLYSLLTTDDGGILDDFMVTNCGDHLFLVVNAACKEEDFEHLRQGLEVEELTDRALLALQGPKAAAVINAPSDMLFMTGRTLNVAGVSCFVTRSGYTGEDGFEISVPVDQAERVARALLAHPDVAPAGLGARDSLRLEAGLCLYGSDITTDTTPIEAGLAWAISKRRRTTAGFPGDDVILSQLREGADRLRVGLKLLGRAPARSHTEIHDQQGNIVGEVTSGGPSPSLGFPIAMGYVDRAHAGVGTRLNLMVRGKALEAEVVKMPFVQQRYYRG